MEKIQKKKKLLSFRLHNLEDKELCGMEREAVVPPIYPLNKEEYFTPLQELNIPEATMDLYDETQQALMGEEGDPNIRTVDNAQKDRLRQMSGEGEVDPQLLLSILGYYAERMAVVHEETVKLGDELRSLLAIGDEDTKKQWNDQKLKSKSIGSQIYNAMNGIIPIFKTHSGILWSAQNIVKTVGEKSPWRWPVGTEVAEELEESKKFTPLGEVPGGKKRYLEIVEFQNRWLDRAQEEEKIYKNIEGALAQAWGRYKKAVSLKGDFLIKYSQKSEFVGAMEALYWSIKELESAAQQLEEKDRQIEMVISSELEMPKAAKLVSPDNFAKIAAEVMDDYLFDAPTIYEEEDDDLEVPPAQVIPDDGTLDPIPIDDDEFLRLKFPENDRMPESMWAKIQFAGAKNLLINITYTKITPPEEGMTKSYVVEPYSMRMKRPTRTGGGSQYYFFGYDTEDHHIKGFIYRRIQKVEIMSEEYVPRWEVEFHWAD